MNKPAIAMNKEELLKKLLKKISNLSYYKWSTCTAPNWDMEEHYASLALYKDQPEGYTIEFEIKYGVHDWVLLKK